MKKIAGVVVALALAAVAMAGGTREQAQQETLEFYHAYYHAESEWPVAKAMRDIFDEFAATHATGNVTFRPIAVQDADEIAGAQIAGGNFPDIVYLNRGVPASAISQGLVLNLKPYIDSEGLVSAVGINYTQNNVNGAIYTVHDQIETRGVWVNTAVLSRAGVSVSDLSTWDGFARAMERVRALNDGSYGYIAGQGSRFMFNAMLAQSAAGRSMVSSELTADAINSQEFRNAFIGTAQLDQANGSAHSVQDLGTMMGDFNSRGIVAVLHNGVWNAGGIDPSLMQVIQPSVFPGSVSLLSAGSGITISANMSAQKQALALEFLKYMVSPEVQQKIFSQAQANPCNTSVNLTALASGADAGTVKLADAITQANNAGTVVLEFSKVWGGDVANAITNALMECAVSGADINARFEQLRRELIAIIS